MSLSDYEPTAQPIDSTPRPKASQIRAAQKRTPRGEDAAPAIETPRHYPLSAIGAGVCVLALIGMFAYSLGRPMQPITVPPTRAPQTSAPAFQAAPPTPTSVPTIVAQPTPPPLPTAPPVAEPPPQTGQGLTVYQEPPVVEQPAPSYIEIVGAQAPHCIRTCDGQPGPSGGDWVIVPTISAEQAAIIGAQVPHKVR